MGKSDTRGRPRRAERYEWHVARVFTPSHQVAGCDTSDHSVDNGRRRRALVPAVRLTYALIRDGSQLIWSHTAGLLRDDEFVPTLHLRDDLMTLYLELLERSARLAQSAAEGIDGRRGEAVSLREVKTVIGRLR